MSASYHLTSRVQRAPSPRVLIVTGVLLALQLQVGGMVFDRRLVNGLTSIAGWILLASIVSAIGIRWVFVWARGKAFGSASCIVEASDQGAVLIVSGVNGRLEGAFTTDGADGLVTSLVPLSVATDGTSAEFDVKGDAPSLVLVDAKVGVLRGTACFERVE